LNIRKHEKFAQVLELMQSTGKIQFEINKNTVIVK
jgi:transmembrane sensor